MMRMRALMIALACVACQVGSPLVDEIELEQANPHIQCNLPPRCERWTVAADPPNHQAERISLKPCMKICGWADIDQDGCPPEPPVTSWLTSAVCKDIEPKSDPEQSELSWSDMEWQDVNVVLRAERPLRIHWSGGHLQHVYIELHGPIELYIEQLELFEDVRVQAEGTSAGKPYIELADMEGQTFSLGVEDKPLAGSVKLRAVHLKDFDLRADTLTIENSLLELASLRVDTLTLTDVTLHGGVIDAKEKTRMSVFLVDDSQLDLCGDARLVAGTVARSTIKVCKDALLRVYNSTLASCSVDGSFELDDSSLDYAALGVNDATRVVAFNSRVNSAQICENLQLLGLGSSSSIKCSGCSRELDSETEPACALDESLDKLLANFCPRWTELEMLPLCEQDGLPAGPDRIR